MHKNCRTQSSVIKYDQQRKEDQKGAKGFYCHTSYLEEMEDSRLDALDMKVILVERDEMN